MSGGGGDRDPKIYFRAPEELKEQLDRFAEEEDVARSKLLREAARMYLTEADGIPEHVDFAASLERTKAEKKMDQREAWLEANVITALMKAWKGAYTLKPADATKYLSGYLSIAEEWYSDEKTDFIHEGLAVYEAAYQRGDESMLQRWISHQNPGGEDINTDDLDSLGLDDELTEGPIEEPAATAEVSDEDMGAQSKDPQERYENVVQDAVHFLSEGVFDSLDSFDPQLPEEYTRANFEAEVRARLEQADERPTSDTEDADHE